LDDFGSGERGLAIWRPRMSSRGTYVPIIPGVGHDLWPFRRSDALFVVAVVLVSLPAHSNDWGFAIPSVVKLGLVVAAVSAWIRFRVFGGNDRSTG
jgi:hypothetical protein